ncbi:hypothetical protein BKA62DRAFT_735224 [Auriculariales sp. MPI-PUGE-AT-0066]|nr:hypothetical protein BKA62DRAFT_735224 [Auriculariales sp. MPI-PUGE-AT-0066]
MWKASPIAALLSLATILVAQPQPIRVDDADPAVKYSPGNWQKSVRVPAEVYWNATVSWTAAVGAYCQLTFNGTSIEWWGQTHDVYGPCDVQVDGVTLVTVQGSNPQSSPAGLLWKQDNLAADVPHTIRVTVAEPINQGYCSTDYFLYTPVGGNASNTTAGATNTGLSSSDRITIISSVVGGFIGFASIAVAVYFGIKQLRRGKYRS